MDDATIITGDFNGTLLEDGNVTGDLNATDPDGLSDGTYFLVSSDPANGSVAIDPASGNWFYTSNPNFHGSDSFVVSVTDDQNHSASLSEIKLSILSVNDPTLVSGDFNSSILEGGYATGDLNATDADGLAHEETFLISTHPSNGSASIDSLTGQWTYAPRPYYYGVDSFIISIFDAQGVETQQQIDLEIESVPDPNPPIVEIISASIDSNGSLIATAELITDGGFTILEVGFDISSSHDFMDGTRQTIGLDSNQSTFDITAPLSPSDNSVYLRPYARNLNGETYGQLRQISLSRSESRWSSHASPLDAGWYSSEWLGSFIPYANDWIYHLSLGWLYTPEISPAGTWLWSETHGWIWTSSEAFPIFTGIRTAIGFISSPQDTENPTTTIPPNHSSKSPPTPAVSGVNIRFNYQWSKLRCFSHTVQMHPFHHAISTGPSPLDSKVWGNEFPHSSTPWGTNRCANLKRTHPLPIL